ncbi:hypothetical protein PoB_003292400 [Plakobranchus ocellatus]|uniref:Uncharacterized protein n=1 Tax=Plakobranchus ocellatus TaxID=259542 RepID=A0AAV4AJJ8_9GAST|nr:hypothetical protein PoB_003292400 [Plakobranchus ocellatus]
MPSLTRSFKEIIAVPPMRLTNLMTVPPTRSICNGSPPGENPEAPPSEPCANRDLQRSNQTNPQRDPALAGCGLCGHDSERNSLTPKSKTFER